MNQRFYPLDVFRGITVAFMILVNNPGSWSHLYAPLGHAKWHGYTPTDMVFPFFLFAVGNSLAFVLPKFTGKQPGVFWFKTLKRTLLIFLIGLFLNWFPFVKWNSAGELIAKPFAELRLMGVLQRIALCYFFASVIACYLKPATSFIVTFILLLLYWALCIALGNPADPYSITGWFGTAIDRNMLGDAHLYKGEGAPFDPEGLASTLPAIAQVLFGYITGNYLIRKLSSASQTDKDTLSYQIVTQLLVVSLVLVFTGICWDTIMPINKKIWTSSFVCFTSGMAIIVLALCIYALEIKKWTKGWAAFFDSFGKNPLFIFVLSGLSARLYGLARIEDGMKNGQKIYKGLGAHMYDHIFAPLAGALNGSLLYAIFHVLIFWLIAYGLNKKNIYIKV